MENKGLITIIVPAYNVEKYLKKCLESIINQTYKNLEIILVDDGSTDNSGRICDEYAEKDDRIIVIHQENAGVSSARNKGIEIAKGEYIGFVDGDDYIEENMYEVLYKNLIQFDVDISMCNYYIVKNNQKSFHKHDIKKGILINDKKEFLELLNLNYYRGFLWNKLFKTKMLKQIRLKEDIYVCEDLLLIVQIFNNCERYYFDNNCYYNYVIRENSAIRGKIDSRKFTVLNAYREITGILREYEDIKIKYEFVFFKWENDLIKQSKCKNEDLKKEMKLLYTKVMKSHYIRFNEKLEAFVRYNMYKIFDCVRKIYNKAKSL